MSLLDTAIESLEFISIDIETTGLSLVSDHIIEIGLYQFSLKNEKMKFSTLIKPPVKIPSLSTKIHGISDSMVQNEKAIDEILPIFFNMIGNQILIAHNAAFDFHFLAFHAKKLGIKLPDNLVICTLNLSRNLNKHLREHNLHSLMRHYSIFSLDTHRALPDAISAGKIFSNICNKLIQKSEKQPTLLKLLNLSFGIKHFSDFTQYTDKDLIFFQGLIEAKKSVKIKYLDHQGKLSTRKISPKKIIFDTNTATIMAFCHLKNGVRYFKVDRIKILSG
jgi:DNA polymerase III epsilon subunit family exonuclease